MVTGGGVPVNVDVFYTETTMTLQNNEKKLLKEINENGILTIKASGTLSNELIRFAIDDLKETEKNIDYTKIRENLNKKINKVLDN